MGTLILEESVKITILKPLALNWCYLIKKKTKHESEVDFKNESRLIQIRF